VVGALRRPGCSTGLGEGPRRGPSVRHDGSLREPSEIEGDWPSEQIAVPLAGLHGGSCLLGHPRLAGVCHRVCVGCSTICTVSRHTRTVGPARLPHLRRASVVSIPTPPYACRFCGHFPLWSDLVSRHRQRPFSALVGGGDQLYNDDVWQVPALEVGGRLFVGCRTPVLATVLEP
jgi:hypothetical protein